jgi:Icc-related predicted phosphoesterase
MQICIISDTHGLHRELEVPHGDILIHAGDFTMFSKSLGEIEDFNEWLGELPHKWKFVVPGNHEFFLEANPSHRSLISNAKMLIDEAATVNGLNLYGSPMTPLYGGAFGKSSPTHRRRHWGRVPLNTHLLITHGPPFGVLDLSPGQPERMGDPELLSRIGELKSLRLHCFGHVHGGYGMAEQGEVTLVNAALMGPLGDLSNQPMVLRMKSNPR